MLGCCDKELVGKTLRQGEIEFHVKESFYKGTDTTAKQMQELAEEADSINLIGKKTVQIAIEKEWIKKEDIITIDRIPHVQIFRI